jgi:tripartite-type tricarboxylate transporter receptor subunit TctC
MKACGHVLYALIGAGLCSVAIAAYPEKPIRMIVPFPPAGAADVMARGMARQLGAELGQQIIVDNNPARFSRTWPAWISCTCRTRAAHRYSST